MVPEAEGSPCGRLPPPALVQPSPAPRGSPRPVASAGPRRARAAPWASVSAPPVCSRRRWDRHADSAGAGRALPASRRWHGPGSAVKSHAQHAASLAHPQHRSQMLS